MYEELIKQALIWRDIYMLVGIEVEKSSTQEAWPSQASEAAPLQPASDFTSSRALRSQLHMVPLSESNVNGGEDTDQSKMPNPTSPQVSVRKATCHLRTPRLNVRRPSCRTKCQLSTSSLGPYGPRTDGQHKRVAVSWYCPPPKWSNC
jgi:hypothetical protein